MINTHLDRPILFFFECVNIPIAFASPLALYHSPLTICNNKEKKLKKKQKDGKNKKKNKKRKKSKKER
jgi:hypothetical protein